MKFEELGLAPEILKAIGELGFESPTPIQEKCIPFITETTQDLIANAQTGTGKTAAFGLPIIHKLEQADRNVQALILSPTRELALQISKDLEAYTKYSSSIQIAAVYGGASIETQIRDINNGAQIVVGTPGRVMDLIQRNRLKVGKIKWLVLDEADEMLNMGFKEELDAILANTPAEKQTLLFSATMPKGVETIANKYMTDSAKIAIGKKNSGADNVTHIYYKVQAKDRYLALKRIVDINPGVYGIVFCRTRMETKDVAEQLMQDGYNADALHGDLSQPQREYVMARFHSRHLQILVATDVAARGLDVDDLTHVINYNLPDDSEIYVHRSGRTGRAGKSGISVSIIHGREQHKISSLERMVNKKFTNQLIPNGRQICETQLFHLVDNMQNVIVDEKQIEPYLDVIYKKLEDMPREELIKRFVSVEFNRFIDYYRDAEDLNLTSSRKKDKQEYQGEEQQEGGKKRKKDMDYSRFYINLGTKNGINPGKIIGLITSNPNFKSIEIGNIELFNKFSFFEVDQKFEQEVFSYVDRMDYQGVSIRLELTKANASSSDNARERNSGFSSRNKRFGDKNKRFGDKGKSFGDKSRSSSDRGKSSADKGKSYSDKGKSYGDKGKSYGDKGKSYGDKGKSYGDKDSFRSSKSRSFSDSKPRGEGERRKRKE